MKKTSWKRLFAIVLIDVLVFVVCLLSFAYFHHVRRMWSNSKDDIIVGRPSSNSPGTSAADTDTNTNTVDSTGTDTTDGTGEPETTAPEDEWPFAAEGVVEKTGTMYRSHDVYINVEKITRPLSDYIAEYYVYDVYVRSMDNFYTVSSSSRHSFNDLLESGGGAIAAISGDFWYQNAEIAVRSGELLRHESSSEDDFCVLYNDGSMEIFPGSAIRDFNVTEDIYQIWNFGPSLLDEDGHSKTDFGSKNDIKSRNPRASIGYYEPGHYCFIVAEGRRKIYYNGESVYIKGIRLKDLSEIYEELGCRLAYNLDGGDSAYGYFNGEILRQDFDRAYLDGKEPRKIYDIICIGEAPG